MAFVGYHFLYPSSRHIIGEWDILRARQAQLQKARYHSAVRHVNSIGFDAVTSCMMHRLASFTIRCSKKNPSRMVAS